MNNEKKREYILPSDVQEILSREYRVIDNLNLLVNRIPIREAWKERGYDKEEKGSLFYFLSEYEKDRNCFLKRYVVINELLGSLTERTKTLSELYPKGKSYFYQPDNKLMIGASTPYESENLIVLHQIYGVPYIPASSLKGAFRNCWINEDYKNEKEALGCERFGSLFGSAKSGEEYGRQGSLIFFDIFPNNLRQASLKYDIQTPHYSHYYETEGKSAPTDDGKVIPVKFLCLANVEFQIRISCTDERIWSLNEEKINHMMDKLLIDYGLGGKTSVGYGLGYANSEE